MRVDPNSIPRIGAARPDQLPNVSRLLADGTSFLPSPATSRPHPTELHDDPPERRTVHGLQDDVYAPMDSPVRSLSSISHAWSSVWKAEWRMRNGSVHDRIRFATSPALYARIAAT